MAENKSKSYKGAGVDLEVAEGLSDRIGPMVATTQRRGCVPLPGGFAGLFDPVQAGLDGRLLVMSTDGVGTKIKLAVELDRVDGLGIDLVAMSVNDVITLGAEPFAFLDYFASGHIDQSVLERVLAGVVAGCKEANCALLGGETAEMPGMYGGGDFDLAGFCVGAVAADRRVDGSPIAAGDTVIGLPSSGVHSNGFSLVRSIVAEVDAVEVRQQAEALLRPTTIYVKAALAATAAVPVHGMAHITGGGLAGNIARIVPKGLVAEIEWGRWSVPSVFTWLQERGSVAPEEMLRVFNMGVGYVFVCAAEHETELMQALDGSAVVIGAVRAATTDVGAVVV